MNFIIHNWFKLAVLLVLLFVAWVTYQATVVIPRHRESEAVLNKQLLTEEKQRLKQEQIDNLALCFAEAERKKNDSILYWDAYMKKTCVRNSNTNVEELKLIRDCLKGGVSEEDKAIVEEKQDRAECIKIYPQN